MQICQCCGQPIKAKRSAAAPTFRGYDDWTKAHSEAKRAAMAAHGLNWKLADGASVVATLPAAWVSCKVFGRTSKSPRDVRLPAARFWADGLLPRGPVYTADYARETDATITATRDAAEMRAIAYQQSIINEREARARLELAEAA